MFNIFSENIENCEIFFKILQIFKNVRYFRRKIFWYPLIVSVISKYPEMNRSRTVDVKSSPNNSTSPAKKSKTLRRSRRWAATDLRFGLVQVLTHLWTYLAPIFKILIFPHPSRLICWRDLEITLQEFLGWFRILPFTMGKVGSWV